MILSVIVAYALSRKGRRVIGKDGTIPWHDPKDLARFKEHTMGHAVIMGRKTFESIGKPLSGRENIIITRQKNYEVPGAYVFHDLDAALDFVRPRHNEVFIIGGETLYKQTLHRADRMYIGHIHEPEVQGDTFFPKWYRSQFKSIQAEREGGRLVFEVLQRAKPAEREDVLPLAEILEELEDVDGLEDLSYIFEG